MVTFLYQDKKVTGGGGRAPSKTITNYELRITEYNYELRITNYKRRWRRGHFLENHFNDSVVGSNNVNSSLRQVDRSFITGCYGLMNKLSANGIYVPKFAVT